MTDLSSPRSNIAVLSARRALDGAGAPIVMSLGGLVDQQLASDPAGITFAVRLFGVGLAIGALPAAYIMRWYRRRNGYLWALPSAKPLA